MIQLDKRIDDFSIMNFEEKTKKIEDLNKTILSCKKCDLCKTATQAVPGDGNPDADLMFIGEAPGFHEDQKGIPFVGRAGKLLDFLLKQIELDREDIFIGNIIKHRPPENRDPTQDEINVCKPFLSKQIEIIQPKVIATLGRYAMNYFLPEVKISDAHGQPVNMESYILYPLYHPAAGLRNSNMKNKLIKDFLELPQILELDINTINKPESSQDKPIAKNTANKQIRLDL